MIKDNGINVYVNGKNLLIYRLNGQRDIRCISYDKNIASYDKRYNQLLVADMEMTKTNLKHLEIFEKWLDNNVK